MIFFFPSYLRVCGIIVFMLHTGVIALACAIIIYILHNTRVFRWPEDAFNVGKLPLLVNLCSAGTITVIHNLPEILPRYLRVTARGKVAHLLAT